MRERNNIAMPKYIVEKRIINNFLVEVEADSPEEAIRNAAGGMHDPGVPTSENEDGDDFYPSEWRVYDPRARTNENSGELSFIDRASLAELD